MKIKPSKILIIKTSSLGDIIQALGILEYLNAKFPKVKIDWVVEKSSYPLVKAHPLIRKAIYFDSKVWKKNILSKKIILEILNFIKLLRKESYDLIFDLQGNCKSFLPTFFAKGKVKIGFGIKSVREWPNLLSTHIHYNVSQNINMKMQYLQLIQKYFQDFAPFSFNPATLILTKEEKVKFNKILLKLEHLEGKKIMICIGSKWKNKQLKFQTWLSFLKLIKKKHISSFIFIWASSFEKKIAGKLHANFLQNSLLLGNLSLPLWQNLMKKVDLLIGVDSSALHLCGTTSVHSFSIFGPTNNEIFKPLGDRHFAVQGQCPYNRRFQKSCPLLRSCFTGNCIHLLKAEEIFYHLDQWYINKL